MTENINLYKFRFLSRLIIQMETPLSVGSGDKNTFSDRIMARDTNELPYIPGTAIAGIVRHSVENNKDFPNKEFIKTLFGYQDRDEGKGSEIIFSSAHIVDENGKIIESLCDSKSEYLKRFNHLPVRQHVRINSKGTAVKHGKFDEEIVYKGTRFCFEIEMLSKNKEETNLFQKILSEFASDTIRIGGGTRKGYGEFSIVECKSKFMDLTQEEDLKSYINKTSSLNDSFWNEIPNEILDSETNHEWTTYRLELKPDDFFFLGSGLGNDDADMTPVSEMYFEWSGKKPVFKENALLIPGSSIKGALSHRTAFHYNKIKNYFAGNDNAKAGTENKAVQALFGYSDEREQKRGNVLISDIIQERQGEQSKLLNHVAIDRFTGGAMPGALFSEEVIYGKGQCYTLVLKVNSDILEKKDEDIMNAFESSLSDIATGMLPLGGGTNRGHGCFSGNVIKDGRKIGGVENV